MTRPTNDEIIEAYVRFDVPSDQIATHSELLYDFACEIGPKYRRLDLDWLANRLITLRKSGKLPKLRDGHGPGVGWREERRAAHGD